MKKVIKGKVYDTETAKKCGAGERETLYQKKTGEFFLYAGGKEIRPLDYKEASEWAHNQLANDDYKKIFGDPKENKEKTVICISIRKDTHEKIKKAAAMAGKTVSEYIEGVII